jgi:hypothetical protein
MDIIRNLQKLESDLARRIDEATHRVAPSSLREPLEIVHAIVDIVEKRIEPSGRGKYVFPFNQIRVCIASDSAETRARFEAVFEAAPTLRERILERIEASGCEQSHLSFSIGYADTAEVHWTTPFFDVEFERLDVLPPSSAPRQSASPSLNLMVEKGVTDKPVYVFNASCINIGRCSEVRDSRNRLIRTNHVVFTDNAEEPNMSVSRSHAHIGRTESSGDYRLYDDQSAHGTSIVRNGQTIAVPSGPRGVRLQADDDIVLGDACLHVELERSTSEGQ